MKSFLRYWLPVLIWLAFIFIGSTDILSAEQTSRFLVPFLRWLKPDISAETLMRIHFLVRKIGHVTEYAILAMLVWRALRGGTDLHRRMSILFLMAWSIAAIFAATDEYHQSFVASRTGAFGDVLLDICGALVGLMICFVFAARKRVS